MATDALTNQEVAQLEAEQRVRSISASSRLAALLMPLASLRLTVALFAAAIFLIFAGTLAQVDKDIWQVMNEHFRTWLTWIDFQIFFPKSFFAGEAPHVPGGFWFPGGWLIGGLMAANLFAAHALRFKVQARGPRLTAGLAVIAVGILLTWMVVLGGSGKETIESAAPFQWSALWVAMKWSLLALWLSGASALTQLDTTRKFERILLAVAEIGLGALVAWLFWRGDAVTLGDSSMRILWQLIKGGLAGLVLLAGCVLVFRKRAGIVLLHAGVALVMVNELVVHHLHHEGQMRILEGQTVNHTEDIRTVELAVIDPSDPKTDDVVVVPRSLLLDKQSIKHDDLPFDVKAVEYLRNSTLTPLKPGEKNPATAGIGLNEKAVEVRAGAGTDASAKVDLASAYVQLTRKGSGEDIGTYLVGVVLPAQKVSVDGNTYDLALRFKHTYKPYSVKLLDFRFDKYIGTQTPKNYSSDVRLVDDSRGVDRDVKIWMNNPLRFAGETFYQESFYVDGGREGTVLQVVTNTGWMIPYVACMIVATGMLAQFSLTLARFLKRQDEASLSTEEQLSRRRSARRSILPATSAGALARWFPAGVVLVCAAWIFSMARAPETPLNELQLEEFGRLPVAYEGRVKPFDTVARNMLRYLSSYQSIVDQKGHVEKPAIEWFLDVIARPSEAVKHKVFRIDNMELLATLGLERREGLRYSIDEFADRLDELERQTNAASSLEPAQLSVYQKKVLELAKKLRLWRLLSLAFDPPEIRPDHLQEDIGPAMRQLDQLGRMQPPLAVPSADDGAEWQSFSAAWFEGLKARAMEKEPNPAMLSMTAMIVAYGRQDAPSFNSELAKYETWLATHKVEGYDANKVSYEAFFNYFQPFYGALVLYVIAFVLVALSWLGWTRPLNRAAFWLIVFSLLLHTFALTSRIYISGRPPVTNLYSAAVFIGWGGVVLGLILEAVYRLGIGNVIASVAGFTTLLIATFLAGLNDGDTLGVLQAVLDTQFWLATHVVCITMGYATTFIAGLLGVLYVLRGVFTASLSSDVSKDMSRMIYGTLCFAMFFSFVGTVLGGLWADDSWGRFWGWDPKENGALIIVLWNALVLHARWGGMVKERGLAALAIGGNIVTGWSMFGVNELGVGLHSYGFTEGVLRMLGLFVASQLAIIALALLPKDWWLSGRNPRIA